MENNQSVAHSDTMPNTQPNNTQQTPPYPQPPQGATPHWYGTEHGGTQSHGQPPNPNASVPHPRPMQQSLRPRGRNRGKYVNYGGKENNWVWVVIAVFLLGMTLVSTMVLIFVLRNEDNNQTALAVVNENQATTLIEPTSIIYNTADPDNTPVGGALEGNSLVIEPWDGEESFTVLVMGLDNRPGDSGGTCRTDTMMVIRLDPVNDRIGILSIPRDTYVEVPGYSGLHRVNTACVLGNLELNGSGPLLAMQTVQYNFGLRINDYVMVDFNTFISIIDRIGGIDVYNKKIINDPIYPSMNYGYDPFYLEIGDHHLDGANALKYARSRHSSDDIDRGRRQQDVLFAVRDRILSLDMLDDLIAQSAPIWNDLQSGMETGLSLDQIIQLALFAKDIPPENIHNAVLGWDYLTGYKTVGGASVVIPDRYLMIPLFIEVFGEGYNQ